MDGQALERFWDKVDGDPETGCWVWTASLNQDEYAEGGGSRGPEMRDYEAVIEIIGEG